jgi:acetyl-CoA carboxylase biotin carboxyl carrier protein
MILKEIEKLIRLVEQSEIAELEWEKNKERIRIRKSVPMEQSHMMHAPTMIAAPVAKQNAEMPSTASGAVQAKVESGRHKEVLSPFVGTFYSAPSPDVAKYVEIGQRVKKGDVLCIIEAMKIMNEIEAEFPGKVVACLVKDGQPVQYGQALFQIEP